MNISLNKIRDIRKTAGELRRNIWRSFKDVWHFSPGFIIVYSLSSIVNVIGSVGAAYLFGKALDIFLKVIQGQADAHTAYMLIGGSLLLGLLEQLSFQVNNIIERRSYLRYQSHLGKIFNTKLTTLDMERHEDQDFNGLITRVAREADWKPGNFAYRIFSLIQALMRLIAPGIVLATFAPWTIPLLFIGSIPSLVTEFQLSKVHWGFWQSEGDVDTLHYKLNQQLRYKESLKEVKLFGLIDFLTTQISKLQESITSKQEKAIRKFTKITIAARLFETSITVSLTIWLVKQVVTAPYTLTIGNFSFYASMLARFSNAVGLLSNVVSEMLTYNLFMSDYYTLLDTPQIITSPDSPKQVSSGVPRIEFDNVSFKYPGTNQQILHNFSLTVEPGENIALVGINGAGKTTIIKLLMRFYDVDNGAIRINGVDLRELDLDSWYKQIGVLFQDFNRYPFNIRRNVELGRIRAKEEHISFDAAVKLAEMSDNLKKLPNGADTILDSAFSNGVEPSGGQWQRVALARAFYRDANILILDEPTAAVDAKAEYSIFNNIFKRYSKKSTLIISHRFSTVRKADRIIVLEKGKVVEEGTHATLLKNNGLYKDMFEKQAEGYR